MSWLCLLEQVIVVYLLLVLAYNNVSHTCTSGLRHRTSDMFESHTNIRWKRHEYLRAQYLPPR